MKGNIHELFGDFCVKFLPVLPQSLAVGGEEEKAEPQRAWCDRGTEVLIFHGLRRICREEEIERGVGLQPGQMIIA